MKKEGTLTAEYFGIRPTLFRVIKNKDEALIGLEIKKLQNNQ